MQMDFAAAHTLPTDAGFGQYFKHFFFDDPILPGTSSFWYFLHELGHGIGLLHPHDPPAFPGVTNDSDPGDHGLNQNPWTAMSYVIALEELGGQAISMTPMAFDIAAVQALYGANMATNRGATTYELFDQNGPTTGLLCIWDTGGLDEIRMPDISSTLNVTIDLRAATLRNEVGGGGFLSKVEGIIGGITIANGVVIENATSGAGNDQLRGNSAANRLNGSGGADLLLGGVGNDLLLGGAGNDRLNGGAGADILSGNRGNDTYFVDAVGDRLIETVAAGIDHAFSTISLTLSENIEHLRLLGAGALNGRGNSLSNTLTGNGASNTLRGGEGSDRLFGGAGRDVLEGGSGIDRYYFNAALAGNVDRILGFSPADDSIYLDRAIFSAFTADGALAPSAFRAGLAARDADDRILYDSGTGRIFYDADGTGAGAKIVFATVEAGSALTAADIRVFSTASISASELSARTNGDAPALQSLAAWETLLAGRPPATELGEIQIV